MLVSANPIVFGLLYRCTCLLMLLVLFCFVVLLQNTHLHMNFTNTIGTTCLTGNHYSLLSAGSHCGVNATKVCIVCVYVFVRLLVCVCVCLLFLLLFARTFDCFDSCKLPDVLASLFR